MNPAPAQSPAVVNPAPGLSARFGLRESQTCSVGSPSGRHRATGEARAKRPSVSSSIGPTAFVLHKRKSCAGNNLAIGRYRVVCCKSLPDNWLGQTAGESGTVAGLCGFGRFGLRPKPVVHPERPPELAGGGRDTTTTPAARLDRLDRRGGVVVLAGRAGRPGAPLAFGCCCSFLLQREKRTRRHELDNTPPIGAVLTVAGVMRNVLQI